MRREGVPTEGDYDDLSEYGGMMPEDRIASYEARWADKGARFQKVEPGHFLVTLQGTYQGQTKEFAADLYLHNYGRSGQQWDQEIRRLWHDKELYQHPDWAEDDLF